jgi:enoyl-CoA hydratase
VTNYDEYRHFDVKVENRILTLAYRGIGSHNFIDGRAHTEISTIFGEISRDDDVDVVVFTGDGRAFCAGGDVNWFQSLTEDEKDKAIAEGRRTIVDLLEVPQPIVAAVNGPAIGLGATLALFSDIIVCSEKAVFADPHVLIGLTAGDGGVVIWPWLVGMARAKEFLLTGDRVSAQEAVRIGLANRVVAPEELLGEAYGIARRLAGTPRGGLRATKTALNQILRSTANQVMDYCLATERRCMSSAEHENALATYLAGAK